MKEYRHVAIIGAGASGFMAAITSAKLGCKVTILEHMNNTARKIEITGNGKCNFTNENMDISMYNSDDLSKVKRILDEFSNKDVLDFFENIGMIPVKKNGYYYPMSNQACAVSDMLRMEAQRLKIKIACNIQIKKIEKINGIFHIKTDGYEYEADCVILATGSKCYPLTGSDGSGYSLAEEFGHTVIGPYPALVQLLSKDKSIFVLSGLRVYAKAELYIDDVYKGSECGEIQFIKNGLSGIPVFQLSKDASVVLNNQKKNCSSIKLVIDFMPEFELEQLYDFLTDRKQKNSHKNLNGFLTGMFNEKLINVLCDKMKIKGNVKAADFTDEIIRKLCMHIKQMEFLIYATGDFSKAQVCCGGVPLSELNDNLESKFISDLFFAGEILNVDGKCGGYNLQWAWSSGYVAGYNAGR